MQGKEGGRMSVDIGLGKFSPAIPELGYSIQIISVSLHRKPY
jgi:hypothetical protein